MEPSHDSSPQWERGFRGNMWHLIFDSGRGEAHTSLAWIVANWWSVSKCGQQILAEQIMEAVFENHLKWDPQGLPMAKYCDTLLKVKDINLGMSWMQPPRWAWWHFVSLFCIHLTASALISSWKTNLRNVQSLQLKCFLSEIKCSLFNSAGKSVEMRRYGSLLKWTVNKICVRH